jgi:vesicle-fusing ATPase
MSKIFLKAFSGIIMAVGEAIAFEYRGVALKGTVVSLSVLELADEQRSRLRGGGGASRKDSGILMEKTDVNFLKASDSPIRLKSSAKKFVFDIFVMSISVTKSIIQGTSKRYHSAKLQV